jgi:hypothetical protein
MPGRRRPAAAMASPPIRERRAGEFKSQQSNLERQLGSELLCLKRKPQVLGQDFHDRNLADHAGGDVLKSTVGMCGDPARYLRDRETGFILTCSAGKDIAAGPFGRNSSGLRIKNHNGLRARMQCVLMPGRHSSASLPLSDSSQAISPCLFLLGNTP